MWYEVLRDSLNRRTADPAVVVDLCPYIHRPPPTYAAQRHCRVEWRRCRCVFDVVTLRYRPQLKELGQRYTETASLTPPSRAIETSRCYAGPIRPCILSRQRVLFPAHASTQLCPCTSVISRLISTKMLIGHENSEVVQRCETYHGSLLTCCVELLGVLQGAFFRSQWGRLPCRECRVG